MGPCSSMERPHRRRRGISRERAHRRFSRWPPGFRGQDQRLRSLATGLPFWLLIETECRFANLFSWPKKQPKKAGGHQGYGESRDKRRVERDPRRSRRHAVAQIIEALFTGSHRKNVRVG